MSVLAPFLKPEPLPIWARREEWTLPPRHFLTLLEGVQRIGSTMYPNAWTGLELSVSLVREQGQRQMSRAPQPPRSLASIGRRGLTTPEQFKAALDANEQRAREYEAAARALNNENQAAVERQQLVLKRVRLALVYCDLVAFIDDLSGTLNTIADHWWRTPPAEAALLSGRVEGLPGRALWLFLSEPTVQGFCASISQDHAETAPPATIAGEGRAKEQLRKAAVLAGADLRSLPIKSRWLEQATSEFGISGESAKRAWAAVAAEYPTLSSLKKPRARRPA